MDRATFIKRFNGPLELSPIIRQVLDLPMADRMPAIRALVASDEGQRRRRALLAWVAPHRGA